MDRNQITATIVGVGLVAASVFGAASLSQWSSDVTVSQTAIDAPAAVLQVEPDAVLLSDRASTAEAEYDEPEYEEAEHGEYDEPEYEEAEHGEYEEDDEDEDDD